MEINPSRLEFARRRRGRTQSSVADAAKVSVRMIKAYEAGDKAPSNETLAALADDLQFPVEFFLDTDRVEMVPVEAVSFRALTKLSARKRDAGLAAASLGLLLNEYLERHFQLPAVNLPDDLDGADPETAADSLRRYWGLGEGPIDNMVHLLEKHGVRIFSLAEDCRELDAFSMWRDDTPVVMLNTMKTAERSRMDAAHELGHLVLHRTGIPAGRDAEDEATRFGSAFLMPRASMLAIRLPQMSLSALMAHKARWGVALSALVTRFHRVGRLSDWQYRTLFVELSSLGYRTSEPNEMPRETSQVLQKMLAMLREDGVTQRHIANDLKIAVNDLERLVFGLCVMSVGGRSSQFDSSKQRLRVVR